MAAAKHLTSTAVVVPAHSMARWRLIEACLSSLVAQTVPAKEIVLCIDNNEELFVRAKAAFGHPACDGKIQVIENPYSEHLQGTDVHLKVHGERRRFGAGTARNAGVALTTAEIVCFIDDDARAEPDWLEQIVKLYEDPDIVAVGGAPLPEFETKRPSWFPRSFDWVFGCAYNGLPVSPAPTRHLIGANLSVRREAFVGLGGFQSVDFDDLDICMRLGHKFGEDALWFDPSAVVRHWVPAARVTWEYFWHRCFHVNVEKVVAFKDMAEAANLKAEIEFVLQTLRRECFAELKRVGRGDLNGFRACAAILAGIALSGFGNIWGKIKLIRK